METTAETTETTITVTYLDKKVSLTVNLGDQFEVFAYQVLSIFDSVPLESQYFDGILMNVCRNAKR